MFGTVKPIKAELKVGEYETYRAIYCTLCRRLGRKYGHLLRASLSYDSVFLALIGLSLQDQPCGCKRSHCVYNPFKACCYLDRYQEIIDRVASISVLMLFYKTEDNIRDSKGLCRAFYRTVRLLLRRRMKKASAAEPDAAVILSELDARQIDVERRRVTLEEAAEPTAVTLGSLCRLFAVSAVDGAHLYRMGYCLGKWIYFADALKDRDEDAKSGNFNPLLFTDVDSIRPLMNLCSNEAGEAFDRLPALYMTGIVRNILYLGLQHELELILDHKEAKS